MIYLTKTTEYHRVDTEEEAQEIINDAKNNRRFTLTKYSSDYKTVKQKGEVVDEYFLITLTKVFTDEKEPDYRYTVSYEEQGAF